MQRLSTDLFSYHTEDKTFTACASTLGRKFNGQAFELKSARTGKVVEMVLVGPRYDNEGELTHWEFQPHMCFTFESLTVFND